MKLILNYLRKKPRFYKFLKSIYGKTLGLHCFKECYMEKFGLWNGAKRIKLVDNEIANQIIFEKIKSQKPFMICRYGSTEFRNLFDDNLENLCIYSGFFPNDKKLLKKFRKVYLESSKQIDYLCAWNYKNHFLKKINLVSNLSNIDLFFRNFLGPGQKWIKSLKGKKVLIIHPFKKTIETQYKKMGKLKILPKLKKMEIIKAVQTLAGEKDGRFKDWFDALDYMKKKIDKKDFDIALIGCGAYGLPLAAYIKSKGKQAIHIGGALQYFFGINAKALEGKEKAMRVNKYWVFPSEKEKPKNYKKVEGGRYW